MHLEGNCKARNTVHARRGSNEPTSRRTQLGGQIAMEKHVSPVAGNSVVNGSSASALKPDPWMTFLLLNSRRGRQDYQYLSDLASARTVERLMVGHIPECESRIPLNVSTITVLSRRNVAARVYAPAECLTAGPALCTCTQRVCDGRAGYGRCHRPNDRRPSRGHSANAARGSGSASGPLAR